MNKKDKKLNLKKWSKMKINPGLLSAVEYNSKESKLSLFSNRKVDMPTLSIAAVLIKDVLEITGSLARFDMHRF